MDQMSIEDSKSKQASQNLAGVMYALLAYVAWGVLPIYWKLLGIVPAGEVLAHRILWSFLFVSAIAVIYVRKSVIKETITRRRYLVATAVCAFLISGNWFTYIYAVNSDQIVEASLGYYTSPLFSVILAIVFLKERLNLWQLTAVFFAVCGVAVLAIQHGSLPWIALILTFSFGFYGLIKKVVNMDSLMGLAMETAFVVPIALFYISYLQFGGAGSFSVIPDRATWLLIGSGVATAMPLLWFAQAARRIKLSTISFIQYIAPTITLIIGVWLYREPFYDYHFLSFGFIWLGLLLYSVSGNKYLLDWEKKLTAHWLKHKAHASSLLVLMLPIGLALLISLFSGLLLAGCSSMDGDEISVADKGQNIMANKSVLVQELQIEERTAIQTWTGTVETDDLFRLSFAMSGELTNFTVHEQMAVKSGQLLASLETRDIQFAIRDAEAQLAVVEAEYQLVAKGASIQEVNQASLQRDRAREALAFIETEQARAQALYEAGAIARRELDKLNFELEMAKIDLATAEEVLQQIIKGAEAEKLLLLVAQIERVQTALDKNRALLSDAQLYAPMAGIVVQTYYDVGERVAAGAPVVLLRNQERIVRIGVPQRHLAMLEIGRELDVYFADHEWQATVVEIGESPDHSTRLYPVKLHIAGADDLPLGTVVQTTLAAEVITGIWVPISTVLADDYDYVYAVEQGIVKRHNVKIIDASASELLVEGLKPGINLIVQGMKRVSEGEAVNIN